MTKTIKIAMADEKGDTPLELWKKAIQKKDTSAVRELMDKHAELAEHVNDQVFSFGRSAVHEVRKHLDLIDLLLENGADLNLKSNWQPGPFGILEGLDAVNAAPLIERGAVVDIWAAVCIEDLDKVKSLLEENPELIQARGGDGKHPLHYAQTVEMVDLLVDAGGDLDAKCVDHGSAPIHYQVKNRKVVDRLLELGAKPDVFLAGYYGDESLLTQCLNDNPRCCDERLGDEKWNSEEASHIYNWELSFDARPHDVARSNGHTAFVEKLLEHSSPTTQLMDSIWEGDETRVEAVLSANTDLLEQLTDDHRTAMARAAWWYRPAAVRLMLKLGFDPHVSGVHDSTPLDRAAFHGYADIIEMLLASDPSPPVEVKNSFGGTPLGACIHGFLHGWKTGHPQDHVRCVKMLVDAGCPVYEGYLGTGNEEIEATIKGALNNR